MVLTSSAGDQISSWYPEKRHSLFTYFLVKAIQTDTNGELKLSELKDYIEKNVQYMARRLYSREQNPSVNGDSNQLFFKK